MNEFVQFISTLLAARNQSHIFHWQSPSYSIHKALNKFYDELLGITDTLVETYQGKYGILKGYSSPATFKEDDQVVTYFEALSLYVEGIRIKLPQDSYIQNQIDELVALIQQTKYKLKNLK